MTRRSAILACALLASPCAAWSQEKSVPKLKVFGIEMGSSISKYKNAVRTGFKDSYIIPKTDFEVPPLFSEDFTFQVTTTERGTIYGVLVSTDKTTEYASKVVDAVMEAYPKVKKDQFGLDELARGEIGQGYSIAIIRKLLPSTLYVACAHSPTVVKLEEKENKKNAKGL